MGFGDFKTICSKNLLPVCTLVGSQSLIPGTGTGIQASCYARSVEFANTIIFEAGTGFAHILALIMTVIMVLHVRSKFTAVGMRLSSPQCATERKLPLSRLCLTTLNIGRKEIATFFYIYMMLTMTSLVLDTGVSPPGSGSFPYLVAVQNGFTSALCACLFINGFVGFQLYEDGTRQSVWLIRGCSTLLFLISGAVSLFTFKEKAGLGHEKTVGLFVVLYIINGIFLFIYVVMQLILVVNTLQDRWPLGDITFGVFFFVVGQIILYVFSDKICENASHYLDGLFFATLCNLLAVMMVYKVGIPHLAFRLQLKMSSTGIRSPRKILSSVWGRNRETGRSKSNCCLRMTDEGPCTTITGQNTRAACTIRQRREIRTTADIIDCVSGAHGRILLHVYTVALHRKRRSLIILGYDWENAGKGIIRLWASCRDWPA